MALETYEDNQLSQAGEVYTYTIPLNTSQDLMWVYAWCAADQASFDDNWSKIKLDFSINGQTVSQDDFALLEGEFNDVICRLYYTVLTDFTIGEHILRTNVTFTDPLNDGLSDEDYPAGTYIYEYHVILNR